MGIPRSNPPNPSRGLPELFDLGVKARSLAYLFGAGAAVGVLTLVLPHTREVDEQAVLALVIAALALGALLYLNAARLGEWHLHVFVAVGTAMVSLANLAVGMTLLYPLLYSWTALFSFYFFRMRAALVQLGWIGVNYAVVLAIQDGPVLRWPLAVGTPAVTGLLMARLLSGLRREAAEAEARTLELRQSEARTRLLLDTSPGRVRVGRRRDGTRHGLEHRRRAPLRLVRRRGDREPAGGPDLHRRGPCRARRRGELS